MPCPLLHLHTPSTWPQLLDLTAKRTESDPKIFYQVQEIINKVQQEGDLALLAYTRQFDCPEFKGSFLHSPDQLQAGTDWVLANDPEVLDTIKEAILHIRNFHQTQKDKSWFTTQACGSILGQKIDPLQRVGLYVPGGQGGNTPLISSLLMTAIPAQVAGVPEIVVISPPRFDGSLNPYILATAQLLGLSKIYALGSAWGIAALAYGTKTLAAVDLIAGPGNIWVTTAKAMVQASGRVGIDMLAGPSEILIIADATANPVWVAADMLAQAEHDALASAICLCLDPKQAQDIKQALTTQLAALPRASIAAQALANWSAIAVVPDLETACILSNKIGPEHLELLTAEPFNLLPKLHNAGAVFLGSYSPEPMGDYFAGPNHVLPTLGSSRFSSALSVQTFTKRMSIIAISQEFAKTSAPKVAKLARLEQLEAHARSMLCRQLVTKLD